MEGETAQTFWEHVGVLRWYVLAGSLSFGVATVCVFLYESDALVAFLLKPAPGNLVFLSPMGPFLFRLKISFLGGFFASFPILAMLALAFVGPALARSMRITLAFICISFLLLGAGAIALAYAYLLPFTLHVLGGFVVPGTSLMFTAESYLSFFLTQLLVAFIALEIPVIIITLAYLGLLDPRVMTRRRRYVFLILLIGFAVITPTTDVVTLFAVSVPAMFLCELGAFIGTLLYKRDV